MRKLENTITKKRKLLCFVIPYFGKMPDTTDVFLQTIKYNPDYTWLLLTDDKTEYDYPKNVIVKYCSFQELKERIQKSFDFKISLERPFKLCDYRPAYGYIFQEELLPFDFWGYCDTDQFFGDLSKWINREYIEKYDRVFGSGHMTIYRNCSEVNTLFMNTDKRENLIFNSYKQILKCPENQAFDEILPNKVNINYLSSQADIRQSNDFFALDIAPYKSLFYKSLFFAKELKWDSPENNKDFIILWDKGSLFTVENENGVVVKKDFLYAHLQKRKLSVVNYDNELSSFVIVPNKIIYSKDGFSDIQLINYIKRMKFRDHFKIDEIGIFLKRKKNLLKHRVKKIKKHIIRK